MRSLRAIGAAIHPRTVIALAGLAVVGTAAFSNHAAGDDSAKSGSAAKTVDFYKDIQPILSESCINCHKQPNHRGGRGGPGGGPGGPPPGDRPDGPPPGDGPPPDGPPPGAPGDHGPGDRGPGGPGGRGGPRGPAGGLRLDDKAQAMKGGQHGKAIIPGKAQDSLLFKVLSGPVKVKQGDRQVQIHAMPKAKPGEDFTPLSDEQLQLIRLWIDQGANWPAKPTGDSKKS